MYECGKLRKVIGNKILFLVILEQCVEINNFIILRASLLIMPTYFCCQIFLDLLKVSSSYHLCVECFSQLSFDSEVYTKSATLLILYKLLNQMRIVKNI